MMKENEIRKCPAAELCGGCQLQGVPYPEQLRIKQEKVEKLLGNYGKVEPIHGMNFPYFYRNKVQISFGKDHKGRILMGNYVPSSHVIVPVASCQLASNCANEIFQTIGRLLKSFRLSVFDENSMEGFLRHVMVRSSHDEESVMVVLVTGSPIFPKKHDFIEALLKAHPNITTIVQNINSRRTSMILGERNIILHGKGYIEDELCGSVFRLSPHSFYQTNHKQTEYLYTKAISFAGLKKTDTVIDAYCGIGTIGLTMAEHVREVLGVEINKTAIKDAIKNAKINNCDNITFICDDAGKYMQKLAYDKKKIDVVIMDPPRSGSDEKFLSSLVKLGPERVVYISCNPVTQKRDLKYLTAKGYKVTKIQPVDMFPHTEHVECIALLCQK